MDDTDRGSTPVVRLIIAMLVAGILVVPLFMVWLLISDRQQQSETAQTSIAAGWGGPQVVAGPLLVIPYRVTRQETTGEGAAQVTRTSEAWETRTLSPETVEIATELRPERRTRSIYQAIVYDAGMRGRARFALPTDVRRFGIDPARMDLAGAELRFGLSDPRGLGANPRVRAGTTQLSLQPGSGTAGGGGGSGSGSGFFSWIDATSLATGPIDVAFEFEFRGNRSLALAPQAGDTRWQVRSSWPHPSFGGGFLPSERDVGAEGFNATYRVGNLALGQALIGSAQRPAATIDTASRRSDPFAVPAPDAAPAGPLATAQIDLLQPVDLYSQVDRATKYGFLFIGFTFLAFLMFDIVGGVRVSAVEYLLVGAGLVLFFVMLLAFAEVIGFTGAYVVASGAITGLITSYSAAVLKSWRRARLIAALLAALYAALYLLLSLEDFSLLIGSMMLFAGLALVMYLTRNLNWSGRGAAGTVAAAYHEEAPAIEPDARTR